jgi:hypothetical protein
MKQDINISFDNIYPNIEEPHNSEDKMNRKLLDKSKETTDDLVCCSSFSDFFSCCCFFLYA